MESKPAPPSPEDVLPFVTAPAGQDPVRLQALDIHVVVCGLLAETTQTLQFFNPNPRPLEGNLVFPLPEGAVVCGYALDVDEVMVEGVVVPRQEARRILEAEERKGVDPGLVEQVQGNLYRTRIYPIPACGTRTVRITYLSDLTVLGNDAAYHLPLCHADGIDRVALRVEVLQSPVPPTLSGRFALLPLHRKEHRWTVETTLDPGTPAEDLQVRLPDLPPHFAQVETCATGEVFFCLSTRLPDDDRAESPAWCPRRLALAWDASGSRTGVDMDLDFLRALLARWPGVTVDVRVFRHQVEETATFHTATQDVEALLAWLRSLPRDGGTDLGALDFTDLPHPDVEAWLLFTDGLGTVARALPTLGTRPVGVIASQARCNSALLEHVARRSGGAHVNLVRLPAAAALRRIECMGDVLRVAEAIGCADLHLMEGHQRLSLVGRLEGPVARVRLEGHGAPEGFLEAGTDSAAPGRLISRAWAGRESQRLALLEGEGSPGVVALGRLHGLVTPGTSLLVLESVEQYIEHDLEPPASLPEMRRAFWAHKTEHDLEERALRAERLERVLGLWAQRIAWWERDFLGEYREARAREEGAALEPRLARQGRAPASPLPSRANECMGAPPPCPASPAPLLADLQACCMSPMACEEGDMPCGAEPCPEPQGGSRPSAQATIAVKPWTPGAPYLDRMREVPADQAYAAYLLQRAAYASSPAFYFDCADHLLERGERAAGLRILSNLPELGIDDPPLLRMYAWRLQQAGELDSSIAVLEHVRELRPDEPQSHRDLGLALGLRWERDQLPEDLVRAMELLHEVVMQEWDRFPEVEIIALMELNRCIHLAEQAGIAVPEAIDPRLKRHLDLDVRISMSWDADLTDVDLHVLEPSGEHAYYGHNLTGIGGLVSRDIRDGYGPEEYVLHRALPGVYVIKAHYYGSSQQTVSGACTVTTTVFTNYGRPQEQKQVLMLRLDHPSDQVLVGEITIAGEESAD